MPANYLQWDTSEHALRTREEGDGDATGTINSLMPELLTFIVGSARLYW